MFVLPCGIALELPIFRSEVRACVSNVPFMSQSIS